MCRRAGVGVLGCTLPLFSVCPLGLHSFARHQAFAYVLSLFPFPLFFTKRHPVVINGEMQAKAQRLPGFDLSLPIAKREIDLSLNLNDNQS